MTSHHTILAAVDEAADEIVDFAAELIRIPTVNPPGEEYETCARAIGARLEAHGMEVEYHTADGRPEHTTAHPRVNVIGTWKGARPRPLVHLNGHFDVVPAGSGWTVDPFGGIVKDGRLYGRGSADMKAGIAAAVFAVEALRRAGVSPLGSIEISGTVDEESGGWAGVAWLAEHKRLDRARTDYVIIPEPLNVDRICVGHRGVYWFDVTTTGQIAHGSMPFLGHSAIEDMGRVLEAVRSELAPALATRTTGMPVVPPEARHPTINVNAVSGGQRLGSGQTPCVADRCSAVFDRRFLIEEDFEATKAEVESLLANVAARNPRMQWTLTDLLVVEPVRTPDESPLVRALDAGIREVLDVEAQLVASPGTYDHKHVARIAGVEQCVAYGPGVLELAHQPDEWCGIEDLIHSTQIMALALLRLVGAA